MKEHWEHFEHGADIGVRGFGASKAGAFEQAALALMAVITEPGRVATHETVTIACEAADDELLLVGWLNALIYEMAVRHMLFARFDVVVVAAPGYGLTLPDRELACAPIHSELGQEYLGAMRAAINCALANRQILTHLVRQVFAQLLPEAQLPLLYDVSHNTCKLEEHLVGGHVRELYVHRKGATRAFGPGHPELPEALRSAGQPVLIGGSMGTGSYVLAGTATSESLAFASACHGAGRAMSRHAATKTWQGQQVVDELAGRGILIRSPSTRGVAEEAPGAYKDVAAVVDAAHAAGLARKVARLSPLICIKG